MEYGNICKCYDGMICSHRLQYIVDFLKKEELKNKLNSINNEKTNKTDIEDKMLTELKKHSIKKDNKKTKIKK